MIKYQIKWLIVNWIFLNLKYFNLGHVTFNVAQAPTSAELIKPRFEIHFRTLQMIKMAGDWGAITAWCGFIFDLCDCRFGKRCQMLAAVRTRLRFGSYLMRWTLEDGRRQRPSRRQSLGSSTNRRSRTRAFFHQKEFSQTHVLPSLHGHAVGADGAGIRVRGWVASVRKRTARASPRIVG